MQENEKTTLNIQIPKGQNTFDFLASFSNAFKDHPEMQSTLLGSKDSLRQAYQLMGEPLGMLACLTAEEEAAAFLYYALREKGYSVPNYGKIHRHRDKLNLVVFAEVLIKYFFGHIPAGIDNAIRIERQGENPRTTNVMNINGFEIFQDDILESIVAHGDEVGGHDAAVTANVDKVLSKITPPGFTISSHIKNMANRRNLCLYGDPKGKIRLQRGDEIVHFKENCISMLVLGFLVFNSKKPTVSMGKLVDYLFSKLRK